VFLGKLPKSFVFPHFPGSPIIITRGGEANPLFQKGFRGGSQTTFLFKGARLKRGVFPRGEQSGRYILGGFTGGTPWGIFWGPSLKSLFTKYYGGGKPLRERVLFPQKRGVNPRPKERVNIIAPRG